MGRPIHWLILNPEYSQRLPRIGGCFEIKSQKKRETGAAGLRTLRNRKIRHMPVAQRRSLRCQSAAFGKDSQPALQSKMIDKSVMTKR